MSAKDWTGGGIACKEARLAVSRKEATMTGTGAVGRSANLRGAPRRGLPSGKRAPTAYR